MKTIWKFQLAVTDTQRVSMPKGAKILAVQLQDKTLCMWAIVVEGMEMEVREFQIYGTGHMVNPKATLNYLATYQDPPFVWHVFERL